MKAHTSFRRIEPLESRIAPASGMDVVLSAGVLSVADSSGAESDAELTVSLVGANIRISDPTQVLTAIGGATQVDSNTVEVPVSLVANGIFIAGGSLDDSLTVDFSGGSPFATTVTFDGGLGTDSLLVGNGSASGVSHAPISFDSGGMTIDSSVLAYDSVESLTDTLTVSTRLFIFDSEPNQITFSDGPGAFLSLTSADSVSIRFASTGDLLGVNTGEGDDTITIESFTRNETTSFSLDGDIGDDSIVIRSELVGGTYTSEVVNFQAPGGFKFGIFGSAETPFVTEVDVAGLLNLTGSALDFDVAVSGTPTAPLRLVTNDGTDPIVGTFSGLPEGTTLDVAGVPFTISYVGGDGNDVTITADLLPPSNVIDLNSLEGVGGFVIPGVGSSDHLGQSVRSIGDFNGDGTADFVVGADGSQPLDGRTGGAYVVFGKASGGFSATLNPDDLDGTNGFALAGGNLSDLAGISVNGAGDVNGDGLADVIVGAPGADSGSSKGAAYVVFGSTTVFPSTVLLFNLDGTDGFKAEGEFANDLAGGSVSSAGDFNGDGNSDIVIGAPGARAVYLVYGKKSAFSATLQLSALDGSDGFKLFTGSPGDDFGASVNAAGDVNGDGLGDIIIGAPDSSLNGNQSGSAYVVFGKRSGIGATLSADVLNGTTGFKMHGRTADENAGFSVSAAGDVNGDGIADIIIGAPQRQLDAGGTGFGYVVFGKRSAFPSLLDLTTLNGANGFVLEGDAMRGFAGTSVSGAGDFNGDGIGDLLVGAPRDRSEGTAYLVFGRKGGFPATVPLASINGTTGYKITGGLAGGALGASVSGAGDVNGDGRADILVGAPFGNGQLLDAGRAFIVYGKGGVSSLPLIKNGGKSATFDDVDGDKITVTVSKGKITADMLTFGPNGGLFLVDLNAGGTFKNGADVTFSARKVGGNGLVNVGAISALGLTLGKVKVTGDLGQIDVGLDDALRPALKSITVGSLGVFGGATQLPGTLNPLISDIAGGLAKFTIRGNVNLATINVLGKLGNITVGGEFLGSGALSLSQIQGLAALGHPVVLPVSGGTTLANSGLNAGSIGQLNIKQSLNNAAVNSNGNIGGVNIGGSINKGAIVAAGSLKVVKVTGAIISDDPGAPSVITALAAVPNSKPASAIAINSFTVRGEVKNAEILVGYNRDFIATNSDASVGTFKVNGTWTSSSLAVGVADVTADGFGRNDLPFFAGIDGNGTDATPKIIARIANLIIAKVAEGSSETDVDFFGITAESIGKAKINGTQIVLNKLVKESLDIGTTGDFRLVEV